jgi:hypothetical protein
MASDLLHHHLSPIQKVDFENVVADVCLSLSVFGLKSGDYFAYFTHFDFHFSQRIKALFELVEVLRNVCH